MTDNHLAASEQLQDVLADLADLLDATRDADPSAPTPCHAYDLAALRQHTLGWLTAFADGYDSADGECSDPETVQVSADPGAQVREAASRLQASIAGGAAERPLVIGGGGMPGAMALQMILSEYQVHGWDLATATGQQWSPAADGVEASIGFLDGMLTPDYQGEGKTFGPRVDVPADAPAIERLLGLTGRDPRWDAE